MHKKQIAVIFACLFIMFPVFVFAQTAAELETVMEAQAVTCAQAARFVRASAGSNASTGSGGSSDFNQALANSWFPKGTVSNEYITFGKLSFLLMKAFNMKGGFMYFIFPGPHYAFRSMVSRSFIQGAVDPDMMVSGEQFLRILGNVLNKTEEEQ